MNALLTAIIIRMDVLYARQAVRLHNDLFESVLRVIDQAKFRLLYPSVKLFLFPRVVWMDALYNQLLDQAAVRNLAGTRSKYRALMETFVVALYVLEQMEMTKREDILKVFIEKDAPGRLSVEKLFSGEDKIYIPPQYDLRRLIIFLLGLYPKERSIELNLILLLILYEQFMMEDMDEMGSGQMEGYKDKARSEAVLTMSLSSMVNHGASIVCLLKENSLRVYELDMAYRPIVDALRKMSMSFEG